MVAACLDHARPTPLTVAAWLLACAREKTPTASRDAVAERLLAESAAPSAEQLADIAIAAGHTGDLRHLAHAFTRDPASILPKRNEHGWRHSALHGAVQNGHVEVVRYLLERGADPNTLAPDRVPVFTTAIEKGQLEIARILLSAGADPNKPGADGELALARAATEEAWTLVRGVGSAKLYFEA